MSSGNLADAGRFHDRRPALPVGKTDRFFAIGVHASEFLAVGVVDGDQPMVVLAAPILAKVTLLFTSRFLGRSFRHSDDSYTGRSIEALSQGNDLFAQVL